MADITGIRGDFLLHERLKNRYDRAVSLGVRVLGPVLEDIDDRPTPLYLHHYRQLNFFLDRGALLVADWITARASRLCPSPPPRSWIGRTSSPTSRTRRSPCSPALGWIGRNNLLVHPELGSRLRLVTILTDMPLEAGKPLEFGCGACRACLAPCPAGAIRENPADFDHRVCYAKLDEFRRSHVVSQHICGVCVKACRGPRAAAG